MNEQQIKYLFGQKIKSLRNAINITQFTLGEMADINQRQITLIELGKSFPSLKTLVKFCKIFNCSLQELFMFDNLQNRDVLENELRDIIQKFQDEKVKILYTVAKQLV